MRFSLAKRFNALNSRPGGIDIITTGYLNGLPVIYSPSNGRERANSDNVLFTLKRGDDGTRIIQQLFDLREGAGTDPLFESSSDSASLNFGTFLDIAPVEIGVTPSSSSSPVPGTSSEQSPQRPSGIPQKDNLGFGSLSSSRFCVISLTYNKYLSKINYTLR